MLNRIKTVLSATIFPAECAICDKLMALSEPDGPCQNCRVQIQTLRGPYCPGCGKTTQDTGTRCWECRHEKYHYDRAFACTAYEGGMKKLMHLFKFKGRKSLKNFIAQVMNDFMDSALTNTVFDLVLPVPMMESKVRNRGFNQSELLSKTLAKKRHLKHDSSVLKRKHAEKMQSQLGKERRRANVQNCFYTAKNVDLTGKHILLIDDILTTGQTASECARVLKDAGAESVTLLAGTRGFLQ